MLEFSVSVPGVTEEGQGKWALAVDPVGERLLLVNEDKSLQWYPMKDCTFMGLVPPDAPRHVIPVQPQEPAVLTANRAIRRHPFPNGA